MKDRVTASFGKTGEAENTISTRQLERHAKGWLFDSEYRQHSPRTLEARRFLVEKLVWWLRQEEREGCGAGEIRGFLAYIGRAHPSGRWGNARQTKAVRPRTVATHFGNLRTLSRWLMA